VGGRSSADVAIARCLVADLMSIPREHWPRIRRAAKQQQRKAKFLSVRHGQGGLLLFVLSTAPLPGGAAVPVAAGLGQLAEALEQVANRPLRAVRATPGWLAGRASTWTLQGDIASSTRHFEDTLQHEAEAGRVTDLAMKPGIAATWRFPTEMSEEERARVRARLLRDGEGG
jgi:hypothetical protein